MSLLDQITPVLLTYQEAPNIERTLQSLSWARDVVVVDSGSTDNTRDIARGFANVRLFERTFDSHRAQWAFGIHNTNIRADFVLALDADMAVTEALRDELGSLPNQARFNGAVLRFDYRIHGHALRSSLFPPQLRLLRRTHCRVEQRGHTQVFHADEPIGALSSPLIHDDRKQLEDFARSQSRYSSIEWNRLRKLTGNLRVVDRVRKSGGMLGTLAICGYTALRIGLRGPARRRYWIERTICELMIAYRREHESLE